MRKNGKVRRTWKGKRKGKALVQARRENVSRPEGRLCFPLPPSLPFPPASPHASPPASRLWAAGRVWLFSIKVRILGQAWELKQAARSTDLICQPLVGDLVAKAVADIWLSRRVQSEAKAGL